MKKILDALKLDTITPEAVLQWIAALGMATLVIGYVTWGIVLFGS